MPNHSVSEPSSLLPSRHGFKLASLNINKLTTHIDELRILLAYNEIDVLSINETKLNETITDNDVNIPGYTIVRRDRIFETVVKEYVSTRKVQKISPYERI